MFIGIVGPTCSGKHELASLLTEMHGFQRLYLTKNLESSPLQRSPQETTSAIHPCPAPLSFDTLEAMLEHVTLNWMNHFVTCDANSVDMVAVLRKRPFFLLLSVEAPMMVRFDRCVAKCRRLGLEEPTLRQFVEQTDQALYSTTTTTTSSSSATLQHQLQQQPASVISPPYKLLSMCDLSILNPFDHLEPLRQTLAALDITNPDLLRPSWDSYFMHLADLAARRSNCMKRRVGCVLVREKRVIATGYNGTPKNLKNCNEGGCGRCNSATPCGKGLDRCLCMHAEENALLEAGRERIGSGSIIYCNTCPCLGCAIKIVQVGVSQVVFSESYGMDELTAEVFRKAGVVLRQHAPPGMKLDGRAERLGDRSPEMSFDTQSPTIQPNGVNA
ncbi:Deoxycytidine monophosphate (dCMP) deaminase [Actinomortierella ambigua]|nr:Deoxycytidine monophosphate (dCMP) deaminase [Actinomortierella ambigua]